MKNEKPIGRKNYGSIGHLPCSRMGPADSHVTEGQARIATERVRDRHDQIIVTEKLDGSNVGLARVGDAIVPLSRAGYHATTSPYHQHHRFAEWADTWRDMLLSVLRDGERLVGEWLYQAHGTRYDITDPEELFVPFDLMRGADRVPYDQFKERTRILPFRSPHVLSYGPPLSVDVAMTRLMTFGHHGALDEVEGAVWRVERNGTVDFLCKYVRPDKQDGLYLPEISGAAPVYNWVWP